MAEFQEVHRQFDRMCRYYQRKRECPMGCPMNGVNIAQCRKIAFERPKETEKIVMSWAAEHPEPVYPLWGEWFVSIGAARRVPTGIPFQLANGDIIDPPYEIAVNLYDHIPADIAEKLGIEPKEG